MRVVPLLFSSHEDVNSFLLDVIAPLRMPRSECLCECRFVCCGERENQSSQFAASIGLRPACQILRHLLNLVELAYLYRNVLEHSQETAPAVYDGREERPAFLFEDTAPIPVVGHTLAFHFVPPCIAFNVVRTKDADAVSAPPERRVGDED